MQMIDVMKRLAELDAQNPNIVKESSQSVEECGMGALGGMSQPHTPASINMTAASGEELSSMLKDIMTLAGRPMGGEEPVGGADGIAVVDTEPSGEIDVGADSEVGVDDHEPSIMRSMLDKLNPGDDEDEPEDEPEDEKPVEEYDNSPDVENQGYDSMVPSGNDLHKEKNQYPAAQPGDNAMSMEESLMNEWKKFVAEGSDQGVAEGSINELSVDTLKSYTKKANDEVNAIKKKQAEHPRGHISGADADKKLNRQIGINQATKRIVKKDLTGVAEQSDILKLAGLQ